MGSYEAWVVSGLRFSDAADPNAKPNGFSRRFRAAAKAGSRLRPLRHAWKACPDTNRFFSDCTTTDLRRGKLRMKTFDYVVTNSLTTPAAPFSRARYWS